MATKKRQTADDRLKSLLDKAQQTLKKTRPEDLSSAWERSPEKRTMLSIRLNKRERALLAEAASSDKQSPTGFIKSAAISRAAHVVNNSKKTTFNFDGCAWAVARLLFTKEFEREYRIKNLSGSPGGRQVLTMADTLDERDEWAGKDGSGEPPEAWAAVDVGIENEGSMQDARETVFNNPEAPIIRDNRVPMTPEDFRQLRKAVRLGGTEFVQNILRIGKNAFFAEEEPLDEPIDPQNVD